MSGLELAVAAVLGSQLLEAKYLISDDLSLASKVARKALPFLWRSSRGRASYWYPFEEAALKYSNNRALAFPRPKKNPPKPQVDENGYNIYDDQFDLEEYTYKELYDMVLRYSYILKNEYGVTSNDTIGVACMNKPLFIVMWLALWNIGALPAFLNFNTKDKPLVHCLKIANVSQVFVDPDCDKPIRDTESQISEELPNTKIHYIDELALFDRLRLKSTPKYRAKDSTRRPQDTDSSACALIYTSGTTGLPKAGIMSWRKAFMASVFFGHIMKIKEDSSVLTAMPLYHSTAAMLGVCPTLIVGGCVTVSQKFSATSFWTQARLCGATHIQYVGEVCRYLLNSKPHPDQDRHNVRIAYGNGLRRDIWSEFKSRFHIDGIGEFYAATESPIATTNLQYGEYGVGACRKYGSIINLFLSTQQKLAKMDPEDESEIWRDPKTGLCTEAAYNEPGELMMRILNPQDIEKSFQGYYGNKSATNSKILTNVFSKGDAWYRSGDLLKMDEDKLLYFVDRLGDTFRWKSENVSATEVENELMGSKTLKQSVVVGVKVPNHEGRACFAVCEPKDELQHEEILKSIHEHVTKSLPTYAQPAFIKLGTIEASHNHKVPKNQFKNQKLPKGEDGKEMIYWLNGDKYTELTEDDWSSICAGRAKL
ncbi:very long-chain fatty acid transport protein, putative [Candida dubliniensis CD36]|uniref:Very long-chain fatty acid transport protein n=1 Tax=Candida dubliniensis (strain CD36 / ATCC MYA-646 / CBS 7987 / NCPF 3949 / NRRL Y-17841) TaxID=573826 RepID=B9WIF5_CANDC|nr:very long-chain fatty acid transport protein, putative [Candida dubliniensis CD36]CAX41020.1 very long-chain fatty acid transport protein, putative [Candida dubliniensis CD36]